MELVCINCPMGCHLTVTQENGTVKVTGNTCPRGEKYGITELTDPRRTLTTTVAAQSELCPRLPVISGGQLPKDKVQEAVNALRDLSVMVPVHRGDVICANILNTGIDILASKTILK